jgi:hypothetical protein
MAAVSFARPLPSPSQRGIPADKCSFGTCKKTPEKTTWTTAIVWHGFMALLIVLSLMVLPSKSQ